MKNLCKLLPIVLGVVLCLLICGCSSTPDEKMMIEDVSEIDKITDKGTNDWEIIGVEKISEEQDGKAYTVNVNITMENEQYETAERKVDLKYINYDKDGWKLDGYENITKVTNAKPKCGVLEGKAKTDLKAYAEKSKEFDVYENRFYVYDNYTVEIESQNTAEDYSADSIKFKITAPGESWNTIRMVDLSYKTNADGLWEVSGGKVGEKTKSFNTNEICKYYYKGDYGYGIYKIDSIDFNKCKAVVSLYNTNGEIQKGFSKKTLDMEYTIFLSKENRTGELGIVMLDDDKDEGCYYIYVSKACRLYIEKDGIYESLFNGNFYCKTAALTELPKK